MNIFYGKYSNLLYILKFCRKMIRQFGFSCFLLVFTIGLLSKNIRCPPVLPDRGKLHEETTSHMTPNETLENDPVSSFALTFTDIRIKVLFSLD